jgi:hypothetical protein
MKSIQTITVQIENLTAKLNEGNARPESWDESIEMARNIYEQLVEMRYASNNPPAQSLNAESKIDIVAEGETQFSAPDNFVSPNQISLIDSIEEIKKTESVNKAFANNVGPSLSQKMANRGIINLVNEITINQRFKFVAQLFDGNKEAYEEAIAKLNGFDTFLEADEYIENIVKDRFDWEANSPVVKEFNGLIERKFL